jgi:hypothetical protein
MRRGEFKSTLSRLNIVSVTHGHTYKVDEMKFTDWDDRQECLHELDFVNYSYKLTKMWVDERCRNRTEEKLFHTQEELVGFMESLINSYYI